MLQCELKGIYPWRMGTTRQGNLDGMVGKAQWKGIYLQVVAKLNDDRGGTLNTKVVVLPPRLNLPNGIINQLRWKVM
jgi:hypothetical protein